MSKNEILTKYFNENEMYEVEDILEKSNDPISLIQSNIEYCFKSILRELDLTKIVPFYNTEFAGDNGYIVAMGNYKLYFEDNSEFEGNVIAKFLVLENGYELTWLTVGDKELHHFGNEKPLEKAPWE